MGKTHDTLIGQIRAAVRASGLPNNALARATGIDPAALSRFTNGKAGLGVAALDALGDVLNLLIVAGKPKAIPLGRTGRPPTGRKRKEG